MRYTVEQIAQLHDFLKATKNASEQQRGLALLALSKAKKRTDVAEIFEVNITTLDGWQTNFKRLGVKGIANKGYPGNHYKLTKAQKEAIKKTITKKTPKELSLSDKRFWTVRLLKQLIKQEFGLVYQSEATYRKLYYSFGFSCHKPGKHNRNQRPKEVERFRMAVKKRSDNTRICPVWYW
jgi:transposase